MTTSLVWCQALLRGTMFNCKAVIFDMDGVIIDSEGLWREAQKGALARWGACVSDEECIRLTKGKRLDEIAQTWCEYCHLHIEPALLESEIRRLITTLIAGTGEAMPGVQDVLFFAPEWLSTGAGNLFILPGDRCCTDKTQYSALFFGDL